MAYMHVTGPHTFHSVGDAFLDLGHSSQQQQQQQQQQHRFADLAMHDPAGNNFYPSNVQSMACDIKPRLTKEQHDILEAHYQKQNKPNTNTKKGFAESLNVSLDKVNNWFQNRRAKAKQDAKKQAGAYTLYTQQSGSSLNLSSDSDTSPSFASTDYISMMQHCSSEDEYLAAGTAGGQPQHRFQNQLSGDLHYFGDDAADEQHFSAAVPQQLSNDMFDSPQELNRRTLTQEQFDAFASHGSMIDSSGQFDHLQARVSSDDVFQRLFPDFDTNDFKPQVAFPFPPAVSAPFPSNESSASSTISDQSMFPTDNAIRGQTARAPGDWPDSRSSSVSISSGHEQPYSQIAVHGQSPATSAPWQPGQSVPLDPNELQQRFRKATQQSAQQRQETHHDRSMAWPTEDHLARRESLGSSMLEQQMSSFAIQTPQPPQSSTFKIPAPPGEGASSIAARRQRPRPAALGLASLRSQSYSGAAQPGSPGQQSQSMAPSQQLRRIRSSNVINGVAQGRVMKTLPGSAQRSPLNWTFADAMTSPNTLRHTSSGSNGSLVPPTPLSPGEQARPQFPPWQSASNTHFTRHASISETDAEHEISQLQAVTTTSQNVASPPHTPMYHHHQQPHQQQSYLSQSHLIQPRVGSNVVTENTPPQSAPAAQQSFPADVFVLPQHPTPSVPCSQQPPQQSQQSTQGFMSRQQQQFGGFAGTAHHISAPVAMASYASAPHFPAYAPEPSPQLPMQFPGGAPIVDSQGNLTMAFSTHMHQMPFTQNDIEPMQRTDLPIQAQQTPNGHYSFIPSSTQPSGVHITAQIPKQPTHSSNEFFVHEYSPPQEIKRQATQRKVVVEAGPKNYTFANQGPEHFEKEKSKKTQDAKSGTTSSSPDSASSR